jgi:hypothetical protein
VHRKHRNCVSHKGFLIDRSSVKERFSRVELSSNRSPLSYIGFVRSFGCGRLLRDRHQRPVPDFIMAREFRSDDRFLISPVDRRGRTIDAAVFVVAQSGKEQSNTPREWLAIRRWPATLLKESAAAVSRALRMKQQIGEPPVRHLDSYLFRSFIRRVNTMRRRQVVVTGSVSAHSRASSTQDDIELRVLIDEFLARCDPITQDMSFRRIQGFSWKEIGIVYSISSHAAESRFGQALQRVRKKLRLQK